MKKANLYVASVSQYKQLFDYLQNGDDVNDPVDSCSMKRLLDVGSGTGESIVSMMTALYLVFTHNSRSYK